MSVFPVAFSGGLAFEGPICENGKAVDWQAVWQSKERYLYMYVLFSIPLMSSHNCLKYAFRCAWAAYND